MSTCGHTRSAEDEETLEFPMCAAVHIRKRPARAPFSDRHVMSCYNANPICSKIPWFMQGPTKRKAINLKDHVALPETVAGERSGSEMKRIRTSFEKN